MEIAVTKESIFLLNQTISSGDDGWFNRINISPILKCLWVKWGINPGMRQVDSNGPISESQNQNWKWWYSNFPSIFQILHLASKGHFAPQHSLLFHVLRGRYSQSNWHSNTCQGTGVELMSDAAVEKHRASVNLTPGLAEWELGCQLVMQNVASANMIHDRIPTQSFHRMYCCEQCIVKNGET